MVVTNPLLATLAEYLQSAQEALREEVATKIGKLAQQVNDITSLELQAELELLAEDFLRKVSAAYEEVLTTVEEKLPELTARADPPKKPRKRPAKKVANPTKPAKPAFVRPTFVQKALNESGLRVARDARPAILALLNESVQEGLERVKRELPTFKKGEKMGEIKRVTVKPTDVAKVKAAVDREKVAIKSLTALNQEVTLSEEPLQDMDPPCTLVMLAKAKADMPLE